MLLFHLLIQLKLQDFYKKGHYSIKVYIEEYSAIFNTNTSMQWLHNNDWSYKKYIKQDTIQRKFIFGNILLNLILIF